MQGPTVGGYQVTAHPLVQTVVASGRVETPHRADVGVQVVTPRPAPDDRPRPVPAWVFPFLASWQIC